MAKMTMRIQGGCVTPEYRGFFQIGMVTRNERSAIIQHGTMTMVRKEVLEKVGGWAEVVYH